MWLVLIDGCSSQVQDLQHEQLVDRPQRYVGLSHLWRYLIVYSITALKRVMDSDGMDLEIIINPKVTNDGESVIQVSFASYVFSLSHAGQRFFILNCSSRQQPGRLSSTSRMLTESTSPVHVSFQWRAVQIYCSSRAISTPSSMVSS